MPFGPFNIFLFDKLALFLCTVYGFSLLFLIFLMKGNRYENKVYKQYSANVHSPYADEIGAGLYNTITARLNACCDDRNVSVAGFLGSLEENVNVRLDETMNNQ